LKLVMTGVVGGVVSLIGVTGPLLTHADDPPGDVARTRM
jgi:hypothetical protein